MTDELLTQAQFALLVGVSAPRINKLVKSGRIPLVNKKIPKEAGLSAWNNREIGFEKAAVAGKKHGGDPRTTKKEIKGFDHDKLEEDNDDVAPQDSDLGARYNKAKTEEKEWMAKKRELEYLVEKKKYIPVSDVKHEMQTLAGLIKQKLLSTAVVIATRSEGKNINQIQRIAEIEINEALKELQKLES